MIQVGIFEKDNFKYVFMCLTLSRDYSILDMNSIFDLDSWLGTLLKGLTINHIYKMSLKLSKTIFIKKIP